MRWTRRIHGSGQTAGVIVHRIGDTIGCGHRSRRRRSVLGMQERSAGVDWFSSVAQVSRGKVVC